MTHKNNYEYVKNGVIKTKNSIWNEPVNMQTNTFVSKDNKLFYSESIRPFFLKRGFNFKVLVAHLDRVVSSQVSTLPKAKSETRSKQNKDMRKCRSVYSERGVPLPVLTSGGE